MSSIVLISCASKKLNYLSKAREIYISPLFRMSLAFAKSLNPDKIFILSAKHGLLDLEKEIEPYNKTLNDMNKIERLEWSKNVFEQLRKVSDMEKDNFVFLAGQNYRQDLIKHIKNYKIPMEGLGIGKQLQYLKRAL